MKKFFGIMVLCMVSTYVHAEEPREQSSCARDYYEAIRSGKNDRRDEVMTRCTKTHGERLALFEETKKYAIGQRDIQVAYDVIEAYYVEKDKRNALKIVGIAVVAAAGILLTK